LTAKSYTKKVENKLGYQNQSLYISANQKPIQMENIQLTQAETHFRGWEQDRSNLIARTKDEIKKQQLSIRHAEATLDRLCRQLETLENQTK